MPLRGLLIGVLLGLTFLGPAGVLLGGFLGFFLETSLLRFTSSSQYQQSSNNFLIPLFSLLAKITSLEGEPSPRQIQYINLLFSTQFFLGWRNQEMAVRIFEKALDDDRPVEHWIEEVASFPLDGFRRHWVVQTAAQLLSMDQGTLSSRGQEVLTLLSQRLGFGYQFKGAGSQERAYTRPQFSDPRQVLGLESQAGIAEIKKQYRQLAKEFHPDHFQNLPEQDPKRLEAQEKFLKIQKAYDQLKSELGF